MRKLSPNQKRYGLPREDWCRLKKQHGQMLAKNPKYPIRTLQSEIEFARAAHKLGNALELLFPAWMGELSKP